ncbi:PREDICTED: putative receptor-like protein kinase At4g00960 [Nicotiana attenuata]|uniref:Cysteine-rich receptor-like protein kinase 10 n=1 Tax=Nicotiana attenuata TaxID=49451 RepID=A0A314LBX9_NICAT|nr:PREDICTED: putative receptor-like protein kinase At4g00960 [Nicotiana attenuata]OIT39092.1 cysteine-rich receptor-like protein kinase 10 [Nicotiana attenuata]
MTKPKKLLSNFLKPFFSSSNKGQNEEDLEKIAAQEQKQFPFEVLVSATKDFHPDNKLGEGGFGPVFKGILKDGREVAVKKLSHSSRQGTKQFKNEAKLLARVQHRNVVNLLGYCAHGVEKLLVYEYVANESLDKILFKSANRDVLNWKQRHDIIIGIARGLLYLHEGSHNCIIHRDIKASNILLDDKWVPKIADFGMARLYPEDQTHVNTRVAGTNGYMAPEYVMYGHLSVKADVFSFGVVVLELISGQKNSNFNRDPDSRSLLEWAYKLYKKARSWEIMDPALAQSAIPDEIAMYIQIGLLCTQADPQLRPTMQQLVVMLSKKPGSLDKEPTRPGYPGSRIRSRRPAGTSHTTGTSGASNPSTFSSTSSSNTVSATASTSITTRQRLDPHGKRPMRD